MQKKYVHRWVFKLKTEQELPSEVCQVITDPESMIFEYCRLRAGYLKGESMYDPICDVNKNGAIDPMDLTLLAYDAEKVLNPKIEWAVDLDEVAAKAKQMVLEQLDGLDGKFAAEGMTTNTTYKDVVVKIEKRREVSYHDMITDLMLIREFATITVYGYCDFESEQPLSMSPLGIVVVGLLKHIATLIMIGLVAAYTIPMVIAWLDRMTVKRSTLTTERWFYDEDGNIWKKEFETKEDIEPDIGGILGLGSIGIILVVIVLIVLLGFIGSSRRR